MADYRDPAYTRAAVDAGRVKVVYMTKTDTFSSLAHTEFSQELGSNSTVVQAQFPVPQAHTMGQQDGALTGSFSMLEESWVYFNNVVLGGALFTTIMDIQITEYLGTGTTQVTQLKGVKFKKSSFEFSAPSGEGLVSKVEFEALARTTNGFNAFGTQVLEIGLSISVQVALEF